MNEEYNHLRSGKARSLQQEWEEERDRIRPKLIRQIEAAFDGVELGNGVSLHQARAMDDYAPAEEVQAARALDTEVRWQDISDEKLDKFSDTLSFMDVEGFRFHIPRFMVYVLQNEAVHSWAFTNLLYWTDAQHRENATSTFSDDQRAAILAFSDFYSEERQSGQF